MARRVHKAVPRHFRLSGHGVSPPGRAFRRVGQGRRWGSRQEEDRSACHCEPPISVNGKPIHDVPTVMIRLPVLAFVLVCISPVGAQTCREVVRDSSGRLVQTIERRTSGDGTVHAVIRDAAGRVAGTFVTRPDGGGGSRTEYRDASGRHAGSAITRGGSSGSSRTTYRDGSGRFSGSATTQKTGAQNRTQFRDASGRSAGSETSHSNSTGTSSSVRRDASGRLSGTSSASGECLRGSTPSPPGTGR